MTCDKCVYGCVVCGNLKPDDGPPMPYSRCCSCGEKYDEVTLAKDEWPRTCAKCTFTIWRNPLPVCVAMVRVGDGILGVRRGIEPKKGHLALPGGFHNYGELWQKGAVRELEEETGIVVPVSDVLLFDFMTSAEGKHNLVFATVTLHLAELPPLVQKPNPVTGENETEELVILKGDEILAFPLHTEALHKYAALLRLLDARHVATGPAM